MGAFPLHNTGKTVQLSPAGKWGATLANEAVMGITDSHEKLGRSGNLAGFGRGRGNRDPKWETRLGE